jgi:hypothetical protein
MRRGTERWNGARLAGLPACMVFLCSGFLLPLATSSRGVGLIGEAGRGETGWGMYSLAEAVLVN